MDFFTEEISAVFPSKFELKTLNHSHLASRDWAEKNKKSVIHEVLVRWSNTV